MTRAEDERTLQMIALHAAGMTPTAIARAVGTSRATVTNRIRRVRIADCEHDPTAIQYWRNLGDLDT